jgi:hypothetical protein
LRHLPDFIFKFEHRSFPTIRISHLNWFVSFAWKGFPIRYEYTNGAGNRAAFLINFQSSGDGVVTSSGDGVVTSSGDGVVTGGSSGNSSTGVKTKTMGEVSRSRTRRDSSDRDNTVDQQPTEVLDTSPADTFTGATPFPTRRRMEAEAKPISPRISKQNMAREKQRGRAKDARATTTVRRSSSPGPPSGEGERTLAWTSSLVRNMTDDKLDALVAAFDDDSNGVSSTRDGGAGGGGMRL